MRKTVVEPWSEKWKLLFQNEKEILSQILQNEINEINHIGSTSLIEIGYSKPIVDILVEVKDIKRIDSYNYLFEEAGYTVRGENGIPFRRYFTKGKSQR